MEFFLNEILEDEEVRQFIRNDKERCAQGKALARQIIETGKCDLKEEGQLPLFIMAHLADYALEKNTARGIPRQITVTTLKDVNIWLDNMKKSNGTIGVCAFYGWLIMHYQGELFRLGRLQFRHATPRFAPSGEYALDTHIPQGEPLREEDCVASFRMAKEFYATYFPEIQVEYAECCSWLLNPNLVYILGEQANISKFVRLWDLQKIYIDHSAAAISRTFGEEMTREKLAEAPETTSLQRKLKAFILGGGDVSNTAGYRRL